MLRKIVNTLREGDRRTKTYLICVAVLILGTVALFIAAAVSREPLVFAGAVALLLITVAVQREVVFVVQKGGSGREPSAVRKSRTKQGTKKASDAISKQNKALTRDMRTGTEDTPSAAAKEQTEEEPGEALALMTEDKLKQLFIRFKVKREHVPVILDLCVSERVKQCPGFLWQADGKFKLLLIEEHPRLIERPARGVHELVVERGISVRAATEYAELRQSELMKRVFSPYLPKYYKKNIGGRAVLLKNLYIFDGDMKFTSGSVSQLMKVMSPKITLQDRRLGDNKENRAYRELYLSSFLWKDGVYKLSEYRQRVEHILTEVANEDSTKEEFEGKLSILVRDGLIPEEYRRFAYERRKEKEERGQQEEKKRRGKRK